MVFIEGEYVRVMWELLQAARETVDVCCYEWSWYPGQKPGTAQTINRELVNAAKRGVVCRAFLHNESRGRHLGKINRRTAHELETYGVQVRLGTTAKIIHAKFWVIDGSTGIICTHNISVRATKGNAELGVVLTEPADVGKMRDYFQWLWDGKGLELLPKAESELLPVGT